MSHPIELLLPDEPAPVRLMNTVWADRTGVHDALTSADDLRILLSDTGVSPIGGIRVTAGHLESARRLRDGLRRVAATVTDDDRSRAGTGITEVDALDAINDAMAAVPDRRLRRVAGGWELGAADSGTVESTLGGIAREGAELVVDPAGPLRACHAPGCVLYFVRHHPRRAWCSISCGNRARAARHYRRLRGPHP